MVGMLDALSLKNTKLGLETLELMGYPSEAVKLVLNRADSRVGITDDDVAAIIGRAPQILVPSDRDIPRSVNEGEPIVLPSRAGGCTCVPASSPRLSRPSVPPLRSVRNRVGSCAAARPEVTMELHERLSAARPVSQAATATGPVRRAEEPGPPGRDRRSRPPALQRQHRPGGRCASACSATSAASSAQETGISREDRARSGRATSPTTSSATARSSGCSPTTPSREIMVNGPFDVWVERAGQLCADVGPLPRRVAPAPDHQQDRRPGRPPDRRVLADGRRAPARRQPHQRHHPAARRSAARWSRSGSSRRRGSTFERPDPARHDLDAETRRVARARACRRG